MRVWLLFLWLPGLLAAPHPVRAQEGPAPEPLVAVDAGGVLRWTGTGEEVALFGVNYTTPFAHAYRAHAYLGVPHEAAIDRDVAHMARLGLEAFRVHVWDREVSDRAGNLLENEHLRLLDYLIARLKERNIYVLLTPIAWWGAGWPEPDPPTPGFATFFGKARMVTDPEARAAQRNYLTQFLRHVNPYTGLAYGDDPAILAIELFNEPAHPEPPEETTRFIDELVETVRATGYRKPIFYNVSQNWSAAHARAVAAARIQGVSFQWYPTGLVRGATLPGNFLPHVDRYPIPTEGIPGFERLARMVYEFDAADIAGSYMYPVMARSFRGAGMQWATQFSYDPLAMAGANTEYPTHYVNLVYTPRKALSLLIAAEAFRRLPRGASYGPYPQNTRFGDFRVSYAEDLSEMVTPEAFYHSNTTATQPPQPEALRRIAGTGSSPVVRYEGTGAYFLDRLEPGVWRLEIYPDAVWVADPFGPVSLQKPVSRLVRRTWPMQIALPDLESNFHVRAVDGGNAPDTTAAGGVFPVRPGVYLLTRPGVSPGAGTASFAGQPVGAFHVPPPDADPGVQIVHTPPAGAVAGQALDLRADVVSDASPDGVLLFFRRAGWRGFAMQEMTRTAGYRYEARVPADRVGEGLLEYLIAVETGGQVRVYPGGQEKRPDAWDFTGGPGWQVLAANAAAPVALFKARRDMNRVLYPHQTGYVDYTTAFVSGRAPEELALQVRIESLEPTPHELALRIDCADQLAARRGSLEGFDVLTVEVRALEPATRQIRIALVQDDGSAWGAEVPVDAQGGSIEIPLAALRPVATALVPRAYPFFLPNWLEAVHAPAPDLDRVEAVQVWIDDPGTPDERAAPQGFELEQIVLKRRN